jgi:septum formation protein
MIKFIQEQLNGHTVILASGSPRRQAFFKEMGLDFVVRTKDVEEVYPEHLKGSEIANYLSVLKANAQKDTLRDKEILITSDTVVWHKETSLAKPFDTGEAKAMLKRLSGDWHEVITSVCFTTMAQQKVVNHTTRVKFRELQDFEIDHYVDQYQPFDKAGGYGIQEWIGLVGIEAIQGSYTNVVGLPTHLVYKTLMTMAW